MAFPLHDESSAPEAAQEALAATRKNFGMIPNLERVMSSAPPLLAGYSALWDLFDETTLTPVERQVVYLTANFENECDYCVPWHTLLAREAGMEESDVQALRDGAGLGDARLEALRKFARSLVHNRGNVAQADLDAFFAAGYEDTQALEVVLGLAVKVMSNYTNSIAATPLDSEVKKLAWRKPVIKPRAGEDA